MFVMFFQKFIRSLSKKMKAVLDADDQIISMELFLKLISEQRQKALQGLLDLDDDYSAADYYQKLIELEVRVAHRFRVLRKSGHDLRFAPDKFILPDDIQDEPLPFVSTDVSTEKVVKNASK